MRTPPPRARAGSASRSRGPSRPPKKNNTVLWVAIGLAVVAAIVGIIVATSSGGDSGGQKDQQQEQPEAPNPREVVDTEIKALTAAHDLKSADGCWEASQAAFKKVDRWLEERKPTEAVNLLRAKAISWRDEVRKLEPDHAAYREARNELKYDGQLDDLLNAPWINEVELKDVERVHKSLARLADKNDGWIASSELKKVTALQEQFAEKAQAYKDMLESPFYVEAQKIIEPTEKEVEERMAAHKDKWDGVEVHIQQPYVFFVQRDAGWDAVNVAKDILQEFLYLQNQIIKEFPAMKLKPVDDPVPVLYFRNHAMYQAYAGNAGSGALAHFEPMTGRLVLHDTCDVSTRRHEGTHQLMWFWTGDNGAGKNPNTRSYWFNEGLAEWYGAANRIPTEDGSYEFVTGRIDVGRMGSFKHLDPTDRASQSTSALTAFNLSDLLELTYGDRSKPEVNRRTSLVYAQGWFMLYFMNTFNVDEKGVMVLNSKGKYADGFRAYMKEELAGRTGKDLFMEKVGLDDAGLRKMRDEYWRYVAFINSKINLGQVGSDGRMIHWHEYINKRGQKTGEETDDLLPELPPYTPKGWWQ